MKNIITVSIIFMFITTMAAQETISGHIYDKKNIPIEGANIYLQGTIDGGTSNAAGDFSFITQQKGTVTLVVRFLGYKEFLKIARVSELKDLNIILSVEDNNLDEVVLASSFSLGKSRTLEKMDPLDIVMTGSSNGDIYAALQSLPGTQKVGEDGRLYIRGGESRETQTFIDGMHVLVPYTSTAQNTPVRSRFSPFIFKGINFSLGGYESEYGQALSSILPMQTKDVSPNTKFGINLSPLNGGGGGSYSSGRQSISGNVEYTNLHFYNKLFPDNYDWDKEYNSLSAEAQYKSEIGTSGVFKLYTAYENTGFIRNITDNLNNTPTRKFNLSQNNYYINSTYSTTTTANYNLFFGAAFSEVYNNYKDAFTPDDLYKENQNELHLKTKIKKRILPIYKINAGAEAYIKTYENKYINPFKEVLQNQRFNHSIYAAYLDNQFKITKGLYTNAAGRIEYSTYNKGITFSPRISLNYLLGRLQLSGIYGKYYQTPESKVVAATKNTLSQELATHYIFSTSYNFKDIFFRLELYYKDYDNLNLLESGTYTSNGFGKSSGLDLYLNDNTSFKNLEYTISYSYNNSKRLYKDYPEESTPLFATNHNATISVKYSITSLKTYLGISNTFTSGRPYNNPNISGFANSKTKNFYSLDMNLTFLLSKKVILYTSLSNVLGRKNVFGYTYANQPNNKNFYEREPVVTSRNRFFFVGLFISLKNNSAYDVSNF